MHIPREMLAAVLGRDGRIYAIGGGGRTGELASVEAYAPLANTWQAVASLAQARAALEAASGPDGRIYAIAGQAGLGPLTSVEAYLPAEDRWTSAPASFGSVFGEATRGPDGRIYVVGGGRLTAYDTRTKRWMIVSQEPVPYNLGGTTGSDGRIYAVGGYRDGSGTQSVVRAYDVRTQQWTSQDPLPAVRQDLGVAAGADGRIYAVGGSDGDYPLSPSYATVDAYDPQTDQWHAVAPLRTARRRLAAVRGADGRIYALGGEHVNGAGTFPQYTLLDTVEAYGPVLHVTPTGLLAGGTVILSGTNFAASATVSVTWGSAPGGTVLATGQTDHAGTLLHPLRFHIPAGVRPGQYVVTAVDERSRYPVTASLTVGVLASDGRPPTAKPPSTPANPVRAACCGGRFFPQTGHSMGGAFLAFYQMYGGLDTFGYPRTEPFTDTDHLAQYTDRFLLEQVNGQVRTAPLGRLLTQGRAFPPITPFPSTPTRQYFPATRHSLSGVFLAYWRSHQGATLLGAPIAEPTREPNGDGSGRIYLVQWCENGRIELHPEQLAARYQVQLGLVGKQALQQRGWLP